MKRAIIIIGWTIAFAVATWLLDFVASLLLVGHAPSSYSTQWVMTMIFLVVFFSMPVLGLVLGLLGKLPGTRKNKS